MSLTDSNRPGFGPQPHRGLSALEVAEDEAAHRADQTAALYRFTDRLYRAQGVGDVFDAALDAITASLGCRRASILLCDETGRMRFVAQRGLSQAYCDGVDGHSPWPMDAQDLQPICVPDVAHADMGALQNSILREGIGACAFIPLMEAGVLIGKFMAYYDAPHGFSPDEIDLALMLARQLGFAVERSRDKERFRLIFERAGVGAALLSADGRIVQANDAYAAITGHPPHMLRGCNCRAFAHADDIAAFTAALQDLARNGGPVSVEQRYGSPSPLKRVRMTISLVADRLILAVVEDVTERAAAEERLRESEERFRSIVDTTPECVKLVSSDGRLVYMNASGLKMIGAPNANAVLGQSVYPLIAEKDRAAFIALNERVCAGEKGELEYDIISLDGRRLHMETHATPFRNTDGTIVHLGVTRDVTERRRSEIQRTLLIHELNHRVKNTLATVQSLSAQTFRNPNGDRKKQAELLASRLAALARAHDLLTQHNWENAQIMDLAQLATAPFATDQRFTFSGPNVTLPPKQSLALAIALHELATNAAKYGALSVSDGRVNVRWRVDGDPQTGRLTLHWNEAGGPPVRTPTDSGFGLRLLQKNLGCDLRGDVEISFAPDGVKVRIALALKDLARSL